MRRSSAYSMATVLCIILASIGNIAGTPDDKSVLLKLISENEDARMTVEDLAFFLVTHDYDAAPKDGYVAVKLGGTTYKLVPNADKQGLADITVID